MHKVRLIYFLTSYLSQDMIMIFAIKLEQDCYLQKEYILEIKDTQI